MQSKIIPVKPFDLVLFGATGDLSRREIIPGLYRRFEQGQVPGESRIIGVSRSGKTAGFRELARAAIVEHVPKSAVKPETVSSFLKMLTFIAVDVSQDSGWNKLRALIRQDVIVVYYLSVAPRLFPEISARLGSLGLAGNDSRIVLEKPFGQDLASAVDLNRKLRQSFRESQIYRIDHYLGKETVQNLMALRFANILFEPIWRSAYVDHVQITVAESKGVGGRGGYYDDAGAMRDMIQNHLLQLLCLVAMEPPSEFSPDRVRDEKVKVIRSLRPVSPKDIVRGQYVRGNWIDSYLDDVGRRHSNTESYIAMRCRVANWRWARTPFFLRTGKRLAARMSEIAIVFRSPPHMIFDEPQHYGVVPENVLSLRLQPNEGITLYSMFKRPGFGGMRIMNVPMAMSFADTLDHGEETIVNAYERLILDVVRGNQTLFMRGDEVEAAWAWVDPIIAGLEREAGRPDIYEPGSSGPASAARLLEPQHGQWRKIQ